MAPVNSTLVVTSNSSLTIEQKKSVLRTRIIAGSIGLGFTVLAFAIFLYARIRRARERRKNAAIGLADQVPPEDRSAVEAPLIQSEEAKGSEYLEDGGDETGPTPEQGLLGTPENTANRDWDEVQRPASIASFTSPQIRYEEYQSQIASRIGTGVVKG
ncbi:hypothetical protein G647_04048 [Cladophialophora carrionii CBS 160.54]|uniref:Uncharacterized protein n=1 Tax=Cladophialophora carrionii CBS 160.54 TaxID=1279043 RepID=V9DCQ0_9EURO|nr:uncharacterized protein G647_04048 [Cladophialophora carrionii CBS 160.54]ETI24679.1 hypothetical protein G647_04048 [Cladophialophora carrionii CBS 160.54]